MLVNTLMSTTSSNPLPNHANDKDLAEEFANFFMDKIQRIKTGSLQTQHTNPHEKIYLD